MSQSVFTAFKSPRDGERGRERYRLEVGVFLCLGKYPVNNHAHRPQTSDTPVAPQACTPRAQEAATIWNVRVPGGDRRARVPGEKGRAGLRLTRLLRVRALGLPLFPGTRAGVVDNGASESLNEISWRRVENLFVLDGKLSPISVHYAGLRDRLPSTPEAKPHPQKPLRLRSAVFEGLCLNRGACQPRVTLTSRPFSRARCSVVPSAVTLL